MKIAIPAEEKKGLEARVAEHFGRCNYYVIIDEESMTEIRNTSEDMGGSGLPPELLKQHGVDVILCKALGPKAINLCKELGIKVYVGSAETVKEMLNLWKKGKLKKVKPFI